MAEIHDAIAAWLEDQFGHLMQGCFVSRAEADSFFLRRADLLLANEAVAKFVHSGRHKLLSETERTERPQHIKRGWTWCVDPSCAYTAPEFGWCAAHEALDGCWAEVVKDHAS